MKSKILKALVVLFAMIFGLFLFEVFLRQTTNEPENLAKLRSSSVFLLENKPYAKFLYASDPDKIKVEIVMNSDGFRDYEFTKEKDPGVYRIAVLGDSFEEALQVEIVDTWQKVLSRKLTGQLGKVVEVYNFGVSGYGTDQEYLVLREKVFAFKPDMVILAFTSNDVGDTYKNQLVVLNGDGVYLKKPNDRLSGNLLGNIVRQTYTYQMFIKAASGRDLTKRIAEKIRVKILGFPSEDKFFLSDAQLVQGPFEVMAAKRNPPEEVLVGWKMVKALILQMKKQAEDNGAEFLVTFNIPKSMVSPSVWEDVAKEYHLSPEEASPFEHVRVLSSFLRAKSIDFYDSSLDVIDWNKQKGDIHFGRDAHYNQNGHIFMGEKMAEFMIEKEIIK